MKRGISPDNWLTSSEFTSGGTTFVIKKAEEVEIEDSRTKLVVFFEETPKGLVLNQVNQSIIAQNTGQTDPKDWAGYPITLYATTILMRGEETPCIRIKQLVGTVSFKMGA